MKHLVLATTVTLLLAGCSPELMAWLKPDTNKPPDKGGDCYLIRETAAPMFYLEAPEVASAGATISVQPWVLLSAPVAQMDEIIPQTFKAHVDHAAKTVSISGSVLRYEAARNANCAFPAVYMMPKAATVSLPVVLEAGTYTLAIATESVSSEKPPSNPNEPEKVYPGPLATRSIVVE